MLEGFINLASYGLGSGGTLGNMLFSWEQAGIFSYALPALLIFAMLFAILEKTNIFGDNKAINVILSVSIALMALQFNFVSYFFAEIFPRMGVLLSIILVGMILLGSFFKFSDKEGDSTTVAKIFGGAVVIGIIIIIYQSFSGQFGFGWGLGSGWGLTFWFQQYGSTFLFVAAFVIAVFAAIKYSGSKNSTPAPTTV
jgi:hypothetical protein